ncbi:MAG: YegP family protein [Bryobacterales bacterium]|nr:YegP family protein [Bryobacterales bacterium]
MPGKFELKKAKNGEIYFNLKAANEEVILTSEMYKSMRGALNGVASVKRNAALDARFEKKNTKTGKPFFVLKAGNHQVIGVSESYSSEAARDAGIASVKKTAGSATVSDLSK